MKDVLGQAISDFHYGHLPGRLWIHNRYGRKEEMPVEIYFRNWDGMTELEQLALRSCQGRVLDIGAGAGSHTLVLQQWGVAVTALDLSPGAVSVMQDRGVKAAIHGDIFTFREPPFDTLLLLMNGIGLCGTVEGLRRFLQQVKTLLRPGGQLLFDSSDVAYLYRDGVPEMDHYYGEIAFQYEYKKERTDWFTWLYIDAEKMQALAAEEGWKAEVLFTDKWGQYLARLTMKAH